MEVIGLDYWFKCGWWQYLPETAGWKVVSFAKVETLPGGWGSSEAWPLSQLGAIGSGQAMAFGVDSGCHSNLPKSWVEAHGLQSVWGVGTHLSPS